MTKRRKKNEDVEQPVVKTPEVEQEVKQPEPEVQETAVKETEIVKPEVKEEVKKTETPEPDKKQPAKKKTFDDLYEEGKKDPILAPLAEALKHYVDVCYKQNSQDGHIVASMSYNLYNLILGALTDADKTSSTKKMNYINKIFLVEKDGYFNVISLSRYDHFWSYGPESKMGYAMLITLISDMADPNTRKAKLKNIKPEKMAKFLPEGAIGKLESFYKL
jgi:hypothetical protein